LDTFENLETQGSGRSKKRSRYTSNCVVGFELKNTF